MRTPTFPEEIKDESCTATIYEREFTKPDKDGKPKRYLEYRLTWYEDGKRQIKTSANYLALRTQAIEILKDLKEGRRTTSSAADLLTAAQRNEYARAVKIVQPTGVALDVVATHFAEAVKILGSDLVVLAAQEYANRHRKLQARTVSEAVEEFITEKERRLQAGTLSDVHVRRLASRLRAFAGAVSMNIASVTAEDINKFLDDLRVSDDGPVVSTRTRDNWADSIATLYEWSKVKRYVPFDYDEPSRITRLDNDEEGVIEIYTPAEMKALLDNADKELLPVLAIGAFAGIRTSEMLRLDWSDVKMDNGSSSIVVQKGKVKRRYKSRRIVPMTENLKAWLEPYAKAQGPVWAWSEPQLHKRFQELADKVETAMRKRDKSIEFKWKHNALRHSFISYRVADVKDVPKVAVEAGNSPQMIYSNYLELVTEPDAQAWFAIRPKAKAAKK
ncbi:MAG TPA: tyrosine-type recombinase/integrase [Verrucomicrobiae bacterium]